jgi:hypothetical protein
MTYKNSNFRTLSTNELYIIKLHSYAFKYISTIAIERNDIKTVIYLFLFFILLYSKLVNKMKELNNDWDIAGLKYSKNILTTNLVFLLEFILKDPNGIVKTEFDEVSEKFKLKIKLEDDAEDFLNRFNGDHIACINSCFSSVYELDKDAFQAPSEGLSAPDIQECSVCFRSNLETPSFETEFHENAKSKCNAQICIDCYKTMKSSTCPGCRKNIKNKIILDHEKTMGLNKCSPKTSNDYVIKFIIQCLDNDCKKGVSDLANCFATDDFFKDLYPTTGATTGGRKNGRRKATRRIRKILNRVTKRKRVKRATKRMKRAPKRITKHR